MKDMEVNRMYRVMFFDEAVWDDVAIFYGSLADCIEFIGDDSDGECFIVDVDGLPVEWI